MDKYRAMSYQELKDLLHAGDQDAFRESLIRDYQSELDYALEKGKDSEQWRLGLEGLLRGEPIEKWNY